MTTAIEFATLPSWTRPARRDALAFFETIALAGLENQWIRVSAADQRDVMGAVIFGKQELRVTDQGVEVTRSVGFGQDAETATYGVERMRVAIASGKSLAPGVSGPNYC